MMANKHSFGDWAIMKLPGKSVNWLIGTMNPKNAISLSSSPALPCPAISSFIYLLPEANNSWAATGMPIQKAVARLQKATTTAFASAKLYLHREPPFSLPFPRLFSQRVGSF